MLAITSITVDYTFKMCF